MRCWCKGFCREVVLFVAGGVTYAGLELLWRGTTHWTMGVLGGALFVLIGRMNQGVAWDTPLPLQALLGALVVTGAELCAGVVLNLWLGLEIWDYSRLKWNLWGQICLSYTVLWFFLSGVAAVLDDWLRHWLFGEARPHYRLF